MDFLMKVLVAVLGRVLADDVKAWCPCLTDGLINLAVRRLPQDLQERYVEEWRAHIAEIPGEIGKLFCAIGLLWAGWRVWEALRIDRLRGLVEKYPGIADLLFQVSVAILFGTAIGYLRHRYLISFYLFTIISVTTSVLLACSWIYGPITKGIRAKRLMYGNENERIQSRGEGHRK